jgi:hypothetical protein
VPWPDPARNEASSPTSCRAIERPNVGPQPSELVDLRGQLSNPLTCKRLDVVVKAVELGQGTDDAVEVAKHAARRPPIRESVDAEELVQQFRAGRMIKELVADYSISESSVKRLLRSHGAGRRN